MTADLSAGVRDAAAQELYLLETRRGRDGWTFAAPSTVDKYRARVDAVTAVVAPEIERPLQARVEELGAANAAVEEENDLLRDVIQQKHARVEVLTAALRPFVESRIPSSDPDAWFAMFRNARAALAAGETESEA